MTSQFPSVVVWFMLALAVICNAGAQILIKYAGASTGPSEGGVMLFGFNVLALVVAVAFYGVSFFITAWVYARLPLSLASPVMAGAIFILISIASVLLFSEAIGVMRLGGMLLIVLGVLLLVRSV